MAFFVTRGKGLGIYSYRLGLPDPITSPYVAVEFDVYQNSLVSDPNDNHIGIDINSLKSLATAIPSFRILGGSKICVWVDYNGTTTQMRVYASTACPTKPAMPLLTATVNISSSLSLSSSYDTVYFGFSSGSGGASSLFSVNNWCLSTGEQLDTQDPPLLFFASFL